MSEHGAADATIARPATASKPVAAEVAAADPVPPLHPANVGSGSKVLVASDQAGTDVIEFARVGSCPQRSDADYNVAKPAGQLIAGVSSDADADLVDKASGSEATPTKRAAVAAAHAESTGLLSTCSVAVDAPLSVQDNFAGVELPEGISMQEACGKASISESAGLTSAGAEACSVAAHAIVPASTPSRRESAEQDREQPPGANPAEPGLQQDTDALHVPDDTAAITAEQSGVPVDREAAEHAGAPPESDGDAEGEETISRVRQAVDDATIAPGATMEAAGTQDGAGTVEQPTTARGSTSGEAPDLVLVHAALDFGAADAGRGGGLGEPAPFQQRLPSETTIAQLRTAIAATWGVQEEALALKSADGCSADDMQALGALQQDGAVSLLVAVGLAHTSSTEPDSRESAAMPCNTERMLHVEVRSTLHLDAPRMRFAWH